MRRPAAFAPLSVTFATGRTGTAIQNKHGLEGLAAWAAMIAAAKRGRGQIVFAHDSDWQAIGLLQPPKFELRDLLKTTGQLKQTRTTRHGHVTYVQLTRYEDWNDDAYRQRERERKSRTDEESGRNKTGRVAEYKRKPNAAEVELELEPPLTPPQGGNGEHIPRKELRRYTGCRRTRGTHGIGYKRDPLGTDRPPLDWPYDRPTLDEVLAAKARV
jgi:hypothetical protein